jgi:hypothetical protein
MLKIGEQKESERANEMKRIESDCVFEIALLSTLTLTLFDVMTICNIFFRLQFSVLFDMNFNL